MSNADRCICCGEIIPEGMIACPNCLVASKKKTELKPCPFCGGNIEITERTLSALSVYTTAECNGCHMVFEYVQDFTFSKKAKVATNEPFETTWNRRAEDG